VPGGARAKVDRAVGRRERLLADLPRTDAVRLVNGEADGLGGITVDLLGPALLVERHRRGADAEAVVDALATRFGDRVPVFLKERWSRDRAALSGRQVRGEPCPTEIVARELGLAFSVSLCDGEHVGLFLDSRPARRRVREMAGGRRVLSLFSYRGGFGASAAAGGARSTTNVDNKRSALEIARRNYELNGLPSDTRSFLRDDAVRFAARAAKGRGRYDLVVLDPPPRFRRPGKGMFRIREGYPGLAARCLPLVAPGGHLLAGICAAGVTVAEHRDMMIEAIRAACVGAVVEDEVGPGEDFPAAQDRPAARYVLVRRGYS